MSASRRTRPAARRRLQAALQRREEARRERRRRWSRRLLLFAVLLALFLLGRCRCEPEPDALGPPAEPLPAPPAVPVQPEPSPPTDQMARRPRPELRIEPSDPLPWLDAFRMQVAARGPRLAECFVGVEHPGTIKWTTSVDPVRGVVSDHSLQPMLDSADLSARHRHCVLEVLSEPPYRLDPGAPRATPSRVGIAIEF